ncbi:mediator of RNA polymerase II transcription subunit 31 [Cryptosporidium felis]|nr:mediator of RNA polymerase II transcription subunit 31 [Cryptosporidium felis]
MDESLETIFQEKNSNTRFILELEFVQCLSNPDYLQWLSKEGYFDDESFVNYLKYLLYWCKPPYVKYISYPHCIKMLRLLQSEDFRKNLIKEEAIQIIREQQIYQWIYSDLSKEDLKL